ncbi:MAG: fatty acid desaturase family protein [Azonexus sp.]|jgi:fatty acid desaturase|nr:fatty acid desaturase family protein [Azonexus sp.]
MNASSFQPDARLFRLQPWSNALALAADWALIALSFALASVAPHPLVYLLAAIVIARSQLALTVIMHEAAHGLLAPGRRNDTLGQWLAAGPLWLSLASYRAGHLKHHRAPMAPDDPVARIFAVDDYPLTRRQLTGRLLAHACGLGYCQTAYKLLRGDFRDALPKVPKSPALVIRELASMLTGNVLLFAALALAGHPLMYVGLWILPSLTLLPLAGQIRAIFEHAGLPANADQSLNARTIVKPSWQTFLCGPHGIHYHIEHHLFPRLPFHNLPRLHQQLAQQGLLAANLLYTGYGAVLRDVVKRPG